LFISFLSLCALSVSGKTLEEVVSQARAYIGSEEALDEIDAIRYVGTLTPTNESADPVGIDLLIKKPGLQKLVVEGEAGSTTSVVSASQGFVLQENFETGQQAGGPMALEQIQSLKANSVENLYFYDFPTRLQVRSKYMGTEEVRGQEVDVVRSVHRGGVIYLRYFDPDTGNLIATQTDNGLLNVEKGERVINGLKFAEEVESYNQEGELIHTIRFEEITVNPEVSDNAFDI